MKRNIILLSTYIKWYNEVIAIIKRFTVTFLLSTTQTIKKTYINANCFNSQNWSQEQRKFYTEPNRNYY